MEEEQRPVDSPQHDVAPTPQVPQEQEANEEERPAKPVDNPDLPPEGDDPEQFEEEPLPEDDIGVSGESSEQPEDPNDLSGVDKEFEE